MSEPPAIHLAESSASQDVGQDVGQNVGQGAASPAGRPMFWRTNARGLIAAVRFLLPVRDVDEQAEAVWRSAAGWLVPLGLVGGLLWTGWFSFLWWKFGEIERIRIIPAMGVVLLDVALLGYSFFRGTVLTIQEVLTPPRADRPDSAGLEYQPSLPVTLATILLLLVKFGLIVSIPTTSQWWPSDWRVHFMWMYPATVYRPLLLAPIWSAWGVLLGVLVGRISERPNAPVAAFGRVVTPRLVLVWFVVVAAISATYCAHRGNIMIGVILSLGVLGITFLAAAGVARRLGGQTEHSVFAAGQVAQLSFLTGFLAFGPYVFG